MGIGPSSKRVLEIATEVGCKYRPLTGYEIFEPKPHPSVPVRSDSPAHSDRRLSWDCFPLDHVDAAIAFDKPQSIGSGKPDPAIRSLEEAGNLTISCCASWRRESSILSPTETTIHGAKPEPARSIEQDIVDLFTTQPFRYTEALEGFAIETAGSTIPRAEPQRSIRIFFDMFHLKTRQTVCKRIRCPGPFSGKRVSRRSWVGDVSAQQTNSLRNDC
jgi:hypothetical protein